MKQPVRIAAFTAALVLSAVAVRAAEPVSPADMAADLERRIVSGEGVLFPGETIREIAMVWTEGPHDADGEAHCGSNVLRRRTP